jgi:WD40 repeat protein
MPGYPATGEHIRTLTGHTGSVGAVAFSPDGQLLATGSKDNTARIWN